MLRVLLSQMLFPQRYYELARQPLVLDYFALRSNRACLSDPEPPTRTLMIPL